MRSAARCEERVAYFKERGKLIEAQRIAERTNYDIEMMQEIGFCKGIENYSRVISGRAPGSTPYTLLDYFPKDFLLVRGREPRHAAAGARHVRRRPLPQAEPDRIRLPAAVRARQPTAQL